MNAEDAFREAILAAGLTPPDDVVGDGKLHRFQTGGSSRSGWYTLHLDGPAAGAFGDWRSGLTQTWCDRREETLSDSERRSAREHVRRTQLSREAETIQRQAVSARRAQELWDAAVPAIAHPYLTAKGVRPHGLRSHDNQLLVPVRDGDGVLRSLQLISLTGDKRFLPGGRVQGCYFAIGAASATLLVCEGVATGLTLHAASSSGVAVAFSAGNLAPVAETLRQKYPLADLVICADDDWRTASNPGVTAARHAAHVSGGRVAIPDFTGLPRGDHDTDFNDKDRLLRAAGGAVERSAGEQKA